MTTLDKARLEAAAKAVGTFKGAALYNQIQSAITAYIAPLPAEPVPADVAEMAERLNSLGRHLLAEAQHTTGRRAVEIAYARAETVSEAAPLLTRIAAEKDALTEERDHYKQLAEEGLEPRLKQMRFESGSFDIEVAGQVVEAIALAFVSHFKVMGAENYVELNLHDRAEPFQRYTVTVQKVGALSPADKVRAAEARLEAAEDSNANLFRIISDIREASGLGSRPMLNDIAGEIGKIVAANTAAEAALAEARKALDAYRSATTAILTEGGLNIERWWDLLVDAQREAAPFLKSARAPAQHEGEK